MEDSLGSRHTANGAALASSWFSRLLEMALPSQVGLWAKTREPRASGAHLSHGGGQSDSGSTPHSRRITQAGLPNPQPTVSRWLRRATRSPDIGQRWLAFLRNHREAIAAMDFFTVPTLTFGVLYCFFIIGHDRRKILRFSVTRNPHALWTVQQLGEACPYTPAHQFLLFDRDAKFGDGVVTSAKEMGSEPVRIPHFVVPGRTEWRSVGWEAADKTC
jgi:hypothetical protein